jgi:ABC-type phosphate/phosphonate transport system permease subunit
MKFIKTYLPFIIGAIILFSAKSEKLDSPYLYILGIVLVMWSLFNISKGIRSRINDDQNNTDT